VKKGTTIKQNEALGKVHTDNNGVSEVHFEVWKNFAKLNPELWLSPK
jgi:murein DD-endopeptidase MepM/ murein hydrolase activator NlpD